MSYLDKMRSRLTSFVILAALSGFVSASSCALYLPALVSVIQQLQTFGYPLGWLMMVYMGVKWVTAEGPQPRENARRGVIYVVIGILLLRVGVDFINYLMCF